ncbi:MAG: MYXO-CTERM sorting domain-containing protein [Myxococcales bacterium]
MRASHCSLAAFATVLLLAGAARAAEVDAFGLGDGSWDGTSLNGVINRVAVVTDNITAGTKAPFGTADGAGPDNFAANDLVLLWQPTGLSAEPPVNQATTPLGSERVGRWEIARVATFSGNNITLTAATTYSYTANRAQVVRLPQYANVNVAGSSTVSATPWNGKRGGIVAFLATGTVTVAGSISADGAGFRGGAVWDNDLNSGCNNDFGSREDGYAQKGEGVYWELYRANAGATDHMQGRSSMANAGGGGDCHNSGGGGGGHATRGGQGGNSWDNDRSVGGAGGGALDDVPPDRLVFGGGGGAGEENDNHGTGGGAGGGVVFIRAKSLAGAGSVNANGQTASNTSGGGDDGAGGGGAGGTIVVRLTETASCGGLYARGGNGGNAAGGCGSGGGGAGGRVYLQATSIAACATTVTPGSGGTGGKAGSTGTAGTPEPPPPGGYCWAGSTVCAAPTPNCDTNLGSCAECASNAQCASVSGKPICDAVTRTCRACTEADCDGTWRCNTNSGGCVECLSNDDCSNPRPTCSPTLSCVACTNNGDCTIGANLICQTAPPFNGSCTECAFDDVNYCDSTEPACNLTLGTCSTCTGDLGATGAVAPCATTAKPACGSDALCYPCTPATAATWCTNPATPACSTSDKTCTACDADNSTTGAIAPCPATTAPVCTSGRCYQCSAAKRALCALDKACSTSGTCGDCTADYGNASATAPCPTDALAWCVSGTCHECTSGHLSRCDTSKPACSSSGLCAKCDSDFGDTTHDAPCPYVSLPACESNGQCLECNADNRSFCTPDEPVCLANATCGCDTDADCRSLGNNLRLCDATTHTCFNGCRGGADDLCPAGQHCSSTDTTPGNCLIDPGADAGLPDAGPPDAGQPDAGPADGGLADTGTNEDAGAADTGIVEPRDAALRPDATVEEDASALPDAALAEDSGVVAPPDAAVADDGGALIRKDAGSGPAVFDLGGCGCASTSGASMAPWALLGLVMLAARRRS